MHRASLMKILSASPLYLKPFKRPHLVSRHYSSAILSNVPQDLETLHKFPSPPPPVGINNASVRLKRSKLFEREKKRQIELIPRIEKIHVKYVGVPEDTHLILNKNLSTPYDAAKHMSEMLMDRSALAMMNGQLWDMNRPLTEDCTLELLHFHQDDPFHVNRAFWRSCSFLLGSVLETVFQDEYYVELHSFPAPNVASGSFIHDVDLKFENWDPTKQELMVFSAALHRMAEKELPFERLDIHVNVANEMFKDNKYKLKQIPSIASNSPNGDSVTVYRVGDHVDISRGPMVGNTSFIGRRCTIASAHQIEHDGEKMYRFQGVALPKNLHINHFAFGILEGRAMKLNPANLKQSKT